MTSNQAGLHGLAVVIMEPLRGGQIASIRAILSQPFSPTNAFADLVYLLETVVEVGRAAEHEILPLFQELWASRERDSAAPWNRCRLSRPTCVNSSRHICQNDDGARRRCA